MPYEIIKRENEYCVVKDNSNESLGCHMTRAGAARQIAAISATENIAMFKEMSDGSLRLFLAFSNNFLDRDGEFLSAESHSKFAKAVNTGIVPYPVLLFHHNKNIDLIGTTDILGFDEQNNVAFASGIINEDSKSFVKFLFQHPRPLGVSHGMIYQRKEKNIIKSYISWEISILPLERAANTLTFVNLKEN
jgi:hypothetical protein